MTSSNSTIKKIGVAGALTASMVTGMAGGVYADAAPANSTQNAGTQAEQTVENVKHVKPSTKAEVTEYARNGKRLFERMNERICTETVKLVFQIEVELL